MKVSKKERDISSKGSQLRWRKNDLFIKKDSLGYEGFAEELVSLLLNCTNIPHVEYKQCEIWEDGELLIPFGSILKKYSSNYLDTCICLDAIIRNEDRHFNNFALILDRFAPLFDHGLSLLSDIISYTYNTIEIDISKLPKFTGRAYEALLLGLRETEGIAWKHANLK